MTTPNYTKNTIVQPDDNIIFESRPDFGLEKKIEEERKNTDEYPKVKLAYIPSTAIKTYNREELNTLLQVLECAGWSWPLKQKPTDFRHPEEPDNGICILLNEPYHRANHHYIVWATEKKLREDNSGTSIDNIISTFEYYYQTLKLGSEELGEIKDYFENKEK